MTNPRSHLGARYLRGLRTHLKKPGARTHLVAQGVGRVALDHNLSVRDLALMHTRAVVALSESLDFSNGGAAILKRAGTFFTATLSPLERAVRTTRKINQLLHQRNQTLRTHTSALATGNRKLQREVVRRVAGEANILRAAARYQKLYRESQVMQRKLRMLTRQIISAQEEERRQLSRELHDEVVQTLVGINVHLAALTRDAESGMRNLKAKLASTRRLVETSVKAVHRFARELRPATLDDLGLIPALHAYCKAIAIRRKIKIELVAFSGVESLPAAKRIVLYRVVQEALTNVARHSKATHVRVNIIAQPGGVQLEVIDNGRAFAVAKVFGAGKSKRLGLLGMKERVEMVGGTLDLESAPDRGTTVRAIVPFAAVKEVA